MGLIVSNSDFVGKYQLSKTAYKRPEIEAYIDQYEQPILIQMLGASLFDLFSADLVDGIPASQIYMDIFNPFNIDSDCEILTSKGIKEIVLGVVYYYYTKDGQQVQTPVGVVNPIGENATDIDLNNITIARYNDSIRSARAIQQYILRHRSDYPKFNGQYLTLEFIF